MSKRRAYGLVALCILITVPAAVLRFQAQKSDNTVEICISLKETREMMERFPESTLENFLERCRIAGVHTLAVQDNTAEAPLDYSLALLVDSEGPAHILAGAPHGTLVVLPDAPDLHNRGLYYSADIEEALKIRGARIALFDRKLKSYEQVYDIARALPRHAVKAHTISLREMAGLSRKAMLARWTRSVHERSCRFLYFRWNREWPPMDNLAFLRDLRQNLKSDGYVLGKLPAPAAAPFTEFPGRQARLALAWLVAALAPLAAVLIVKRGLADEFSLASAAARAARLWGSALAVALLAGLTIPFLLPDTVFVNGLAQFRGVKAALALPLLGAGALLFEPSRIEALLKRNVTVFGLLAMGAAALVLALMLDRSGNFSPFVSGPELRLRDALENLLGARPRFKEFLIGHPLLILGIYMHISGDERGKAWALPCIWIGTLGLISMINSFCHLHTPLAVTLLRTAHGIWIGGLLGAGLAYATKFIFRVRLTVA
ncbi:MAG: hypothetical protein A2901_07900 [Elusimicrobia bacterium RIFCSPLOWO2_01_FULL_54_10]|nr:MAG: hypothetical protein A2901_07900 [Elusimicrobia bacterium RIFCSPLOWO2_01_FULL_54_10]